MLTSITPVGEVARRQRWSTTAACFVVGATVAGAVRGALLGLLGALALATTASSTRLVVLAVVAASTGVLATIGRLPSPHRQVDEQWLTGYRGWVYGGGFGAQLGLGVVTYVTTPLVWTLLAVELLTASPLHGGLVGAVFGVGRGLQVLLVRQVHTHSDLQRLMAAIEARRPSATRVASLANVLVVPTALLAAVLLWA